MDIQEFIEKFTEQLIDESVNISGITKFRDLDSWDSMTGMVVLLMIEENYNVKISPDLFKSLNTVQELFDHICNVSK
jgi:acyl carrier protein